MTYKGMRREKGARGMYFTMTDNGNEGDTNVIVQCDESISDTIIEDNLIL